MRVRADLTITVWYDDVKSSDDCVQQLNEIAEFASRTGMLSGDYDMTVDTWERVIEVETVY